MYRTVNTGYGTIQFNKDTRKSYRKTWKEKREKEKEGDNQN